MNNLKIDKISRGSDIILYDALNGYVPDHLCNKSYVKEIVDRDIEEVEDQIMLLIPDYGVFNIEGVKDSEDQQLLTSVHALLLAKASNTIELVGQLHPADQLMFFYHIQRFLFVNLHGGMSHRDRAYGAFTSEDYMDCVEVVEKMEQLELVQDLKAVVEKIRGQMASSIEGRGYKVLMVEQDMGALITRGVCDSWKRIRGLCRDYVCKVKPTDRRVERSFQVPEHENLVPEQIFFTKGEVVTIAPDLSGERDYDRQREELSSFERIQVIKDAVKGAQAFHGFGYAHLDMKPSNIMVFRDLTSGRVSAKLTDFETAEQLGNDKISRLTFFYSEKDFHMPSFYYKADTAADVYGIGCMILDEVVGKVQREEFLIKVVPYLVDAFLEDEREVDGAMIMERRVSELEAKRGYVEMGLKMIDIMIGDEIEGLESFSQYYVDQFRKIFDLDSILPYEAVEFLMRMITLVRKQRPNMDEVIEFLDKYGEILACARGK